MPREKLTQKRVDRATPPPGQRKLDLFDTDCKGLVVEVRHSGKSYFLRYSSAHKRTCQRKLADTDHLTLAEARKLARERLAQIALGEDPFAPPEEKPQAPTLGAFIQQCYLPYTKEYKRSWETDECLLRNHVLPTFGNTGMDKITRQDFMDFFSEHRETHKPASTNRVYLTSTIVAGRRQLFWPVDGSCR